MAIDPDKALNAEPTVREMCWTKRDVLLYHLSLGAGRHANADPELRYTYEGDLQVLPTFATVAGQGISAGDLGVTSLAIPGIDVELRKLLHAGQSIAVHQQLPPSGSATVSSSVAHVWDKGRAAVIELKQSAVDAGGEPLWTSIMQLWARGEGDFGGDSGPESSWAAPKREPDFVLDSPTTHGQALLYRLNGDLNPLHADPDFARLAGFDRPILHGLASYGIVAKALVDGILSGDASRLNGLTVRFSGVVFPGETIRTAAWREGDALVLEATCPERGGVPVLTHASADVTT